MTGFLKPFPVLPSADELRAFEAEIGFDLPDDYRAFLLGYNGGVVSRPEPDDDMAILGFYATPVPPLADHREWVAPDNFWSVSLFHGLLRRENQYGDLREIYPVMRDEWDHPAELLPVASMDNNGKYFLCVAGARRGQVLIASDAYLDKRAEGLTITSADYHRLADCFGGLLDSLVWQTG